MQRWKGLFDDLEAQAEALARGELDAEVRDRIRREAVAGPARRPAGAVRRRAGAGCTWPGPASCTGRCSTPGWTGCCSRRGPAARCWCPCCRCCRVTGVGRRAQAPGADGEVGKRLDLRWALRGLARDRAGLAVVLRDGTALGGTLDRVGADFVELAEHGTGEARRGSAVLGLRLVPLEALGLLRRV